MTALLLILGASLLLTVVAQWNEIDRLRLENARLAIENSSYRAAASDLTDTMASLRFEMTELAWRADGEAARLRTIDRLQSELASDVWRAAAPPVARSTFVKLQALLGALGDRLALVRQGAAYREALAEATPVIWPTDGWISGTYGFRADPFTGERDFHPAVDISTDKGQPVYATATGRVFSAGRNGPYGNLVEIDHGFGLVTRYGHLSEFAVRVGDTVRRGEVIGYVGATGRATGYHVHYEVWVGDRTVDPMMLRSDPVSVAAN